MDGSFWLEGLHIKTVNNKSKSYHFEWETFAQDSQDHQTDHEDSEHHEEHKNELVHTDEHAHEHLAWHTEHHHINSELQICDKDHHAGTHYHDAERQREHKNEWTVASISLTMKEIWETFGGRFRSFYNTFGEEKK